LSASGGVGGEFFRRVEDFLEAAVVFDREGERQLRVEITDGR